MDGPPLLLRRLAACLSSGDVDAAAALFSPQGHITLHDGDHPVGRVHPGEGLAAVVHAFSDIGYAAVLHHAGSAWQEDGVLTGVHRSAFLGAPPTGRRVYLNVHLRADVGDDGLLVDLFVTTSQASLRHQLQGGGDAQAVADGLTAEVRHRMRTARPVVEGRPDPAADASAGEVVAQDNAEMGVAHAQKPQGGRPAAKVLGAAVLLVLLLAAVASRVLPAVGGDESSPELPPVVSSPGTVQSMPTTDPTAQSVSATTTASPAASPSSPSAGSAVIVLPTGPPQVQPGRQVVLPSDVLFGLDSAQLSPETQNALSDLAQQIKTAHITGQIQVNGYTDNLGSAAHGLDLSRQRALAVAQALQAALGASPVTLLPQGFGDADPIADNGTEQGRARNRRVTIVLPTTTG